MWRLFFLSGKCHVIELEMLYGNTRFEDKVCWEGSSGLGGNFAREEEGERDLKKTIA